MRLVVMLASLALSINDGWLAGCQALQTYYRAMLTAIGSTDMTKTCKAQRSRLTTTHQRSQLG